MKRLVFYVDVVSPYAYLAFERLPEVLAGCSCEVEYRPVLLAGLLGHWGNVGPAEIEPKRAWTFRQVHWLAAQLDIPIETPATHPFNPLALLRLLQACGPNRYVTETVLRHVWREGGEAADPTRLGALAARLSPALDPGSDEVKAALRRQTEDAARAGVFGVPTIECDGRLFWGLDALPMLRAAMLEDPWFDGPEWDRQGAVRPGVQRR